MAYESSKSSTKNQIAKPGASTKSSAKLAANSGETKGGMPTKSGSEVAAQECDAIEAELAALKVAYEHYFLGLDRHPPTRTYEELKKRLERLKNSFVRNTGAKFRVQSVHSKFVTYERLWQRTLLEIENGTYKRDLAKVRRRTQKAPDKTKGRQGAVDLSQDADFEVDEVDEVLSSAFKSPPPAVPAVAPAVAPMEPVPFRGVAPAVAPLVPSVAPLVPSIAPLVPPVARMPSIAPVVPPVAPAIAPVAARPPGTGPRPAVPAVRPPSAGSASDLSDDKLKTVYDAYVSAKRRNKEDTSKMSYDSIAATLRKQVPELMKQHGAKAVEFKVVIKDGKAVLKAVPK